MGMTDAAEFVEFDCPHCSRRASARLEECGETRECPHCRMPFEVPLRAEAPGTAAQGRLRGRAFRFQCVRCGSILEATSDQSGQRGRCPTCGGTFIVPPVDERTGLAQYNADPGADGENPTPMHAYAAAGSKAPQILRREDDSLVIVCPRCRRESDVAADSCPACGLPFTMEGLEVVAADASGTGQAALVLGIIALVTCWCPFVGLLPGIIAIVLGARAMRQPPAVRSAGAAVGLGLGVVACTIAILVTYAMTV